MNKVASLRDGFNPPTRPIYRRRPIPTTGKSWANLRKRKNTYTHDKEVAGYQGKSWANSAAYPRARRCSTYGTDVGVDSHRGITRQRTYGTLMQIERHWNKGYWEY